jgi:hypothetical protein
LSEKIEALHDNRITNEEDDEELSDETQHTPLLFVDVNLGPNDSRRIVVNQGDRSSQLARDFCEENNLDEETYEKLELLLTEQIQSVLTKIEEEAVSSDN